MEAVQSDFNWMRGRVDIEKSLAGLALVAGGASSVFLAGGARLEKKAGIDPMVAIKAPHRQRISEAAAVSEWSVLAISEIDAAARKAAASVSVLGYPRAWTDVTAAKIQAARSGGGDRI